MGSAGPVRITVDEERRAVALARDLIGVSEVDLQPERGRWVLSLSARHTGNLVVRVLESVRRSLAGDPTASALISLDGREYHMHGECVPLNGDSDGDMPAIAHRIRTEQSGEDIVVVSLAGEHDLYTAPRIEAALGGAIASGRAVVVVDLHETTFLDSTVLAILLHARAELTDHRRLALVCDDPKIKRVFELSGTDRLFEFFTSRSALEASHQTIEAR
jgi:anti-sigma B factor antagonist